VFYYSRNWEVFCSWFCLLGLSLPPGGGGLGLRPRAAARSAGEPEGLQRQPQNKPLPKAKNTHFISPFALRWKSC
jgi:hypothetical protein